MSENKLEVYVSFTGMVPQGVGLDIERRRNTRHGSVFVFPFYVDWEQYEPVALLVEEIQRASSWVAIIGEVSGPYDIQAIAFLTRKTGIQPVVAVYNPHYVKNGVWSVITQEDCKEDPNDWR